ncbi:hypothetical protein [Saccharothrix longispora]|uniref:hypothetical protein n=1 Tax=Saccharothrix longispora TaxID=33920 RepID=UPI0028FD010A|nr:hypothetical protein [Saccharothrix longispora]MBY8849705.1 hypothetical protein [Saccharothrix sp. MB29]MDU0288844.1 hypothetical protein [Saccharothrix longispora]
MKRALTAVAVAVAAVVVPPAQASAEAEHDDGFVVWTTDRCGSVEFVDYGPGEPGSGGDDDYLVVRDHCDDGYEVKADGWLGWYWLRVKYVDGPAAGPVFWDPFVEHGGLYGGDRLGLTACQYDRDQAASGYLGFNCASDQRVLVDG